MTSLSSTLCKTAAFAMVNDLGGLTCRVFPATVARGNLQVHRPEGNVLLHHAEFDPISGVPDYNARVRIEVGRA